MMGVYGHNLAVLGQVMSMGEVLDEDRIWQVLSDLFQVGNLAPECRTLPERPWHTSSLMLTASEG